MSALSFGSWVTFGWQLDHGLIRDCMAVAHDAGVNFFDNAEAYAAGESELLMGRAITELGWPRESYVLSTKLYWGLSDVVNMHDTLNRKYLLHSINGCLDRLGVEHVDLVFCHRPDPDTPIEETVWAMSDLVESGKATYWGTSEWEAADIRAAWDIAERHHLRKPVTEQPQYNLLEREKVEQEYAQLYREIGLGITAWSPLASGLLTGKYLEGIPEGTRAGLAGHEWLRDLLTDPRRNEYVRQYLAIADELECDLSALAIAWCASNPNVSTVITGASRVEHVEQNLKALDVLPLLTPEIKARLDAVVA